MATPFSQIYERAIFKVRDNDFARLNDIDKETVLYNYLQSAESDFANKCRQNLNNKNLDEQEYVDDLDIESVEILATGIAYYWISSKVLDSENLKNQLSTKDYSFFSPANLLREMKELRESLHKEYRQKLIQYTYYGNNIASLKV